MPTAEISLFIAIALFFWVYVITKRLTKLEAKVFAETPPAKVDGLPSWAVTDESLASLTVSEDGMSAMLLPLGPVGSFQVQVKADADLGEGVKEILGSLDVELAAGEAVSVEIAAGAPEPQ